MVELLGYFIAGILTIVNSVILVFLNKKYKMEELRLERQQAQEDTANLLKQGVQLILYFNIKSEALKLLSQDKVEFYEYEFLSKMHVIYHKFGGNGDLDHLMESVFDKVLSYR